MKTLTVSALVCTVMVLARANENTDLVTGEASCPSNWTEISGRCFYYVAETLTWADAEMNCQAMGANLASVHAADEYLYIQTMIVKLTQGFGRTWIGGSDCQKEGVWLWSDGTPFKYRHCGIFDNRWWKQHCLQMNFGANKCWDDERCSRKLPSVCAKKP